jgi:hypothetical protein
MLELATDPDHTEKVENLSEPTRHSFDTSLHSDPTIERVAVLPGKNEEISQNFI